MLWTIFALFIVWLILTAVYQTELVEAFNYIANKIKKWYNLNKLKNGTENFLHILVLRMVCLALNKEIRYENSKWLYENPKRL